MRITRLGLRNYRVFEDAVDLELPPGLVGIYGANGSGKSALLESITWALWGKARRADKTVMGARHGLQPALGQRPDGTWSFHP